MWTLPLPCIDSAREELETALSRDRGAPPYHLTDPEKDEIESLYQSYDDGDGRPEDGLTAPALADALKTALYDAFAHVQKNKRLHDLRERLKLPADDCPLCGFGAVTDLDHYLPQSKYKALSIYARNLVPCCHPCNRKKLAVAEGDADQQFVHAYFEDIPRERFFFTDVAIENDGLKVEFRAEQSASMDEDTFKRIKFQIDKLNLNVRYQREVITFVTSQATNFDDVYNNGGAENLRDLLLRNAGNHVKNYGLNDWRTALCYGLADCGEFINGGFSQACGVRRGYVGA